MIEVKPEIHNALGGCMQVPGGVHADPRKRLALLFLDVCVFA